MPKNCSSVGTHMRPNIKISHSLNGRVKDFAAEHEINVSKAYRLIIVAGLEELQCRDELPDDPDAERMDDE